MKVNIIARTGLSKKSSTLNTLRHDRIFWIAFALLAASVLLYVILDLPVQQRLTPVADFSDVLKHGAVFLALVYGLMQKGFKPERHFWAGVGFSAGVMFFGELLILFVPGSPGSQFTDILVQAICILFYLGLVWALKSSQPHREEQREGQLVWLRTAGLAVLITSLVLYFACLPTVFDLDDKVVWVPSLFIYAALDVIMCAEFVRARGQLTDQRWRTMLGSMAGLMMVCAALDAIDALLMMHSFANVSSSLIWSLAWYLPPAILIVLARANLAAPRLTPDPEIIRDGKSLHFGPLLVYMMVLPLLHISLSATGWLESLLQGPRDALVGLVLFVMGLLAFFYQRAVGAENEATHRELSISRERYESFLRTSGEGIYLGELEQPVSITAPETGAGS